jgi:hypothetical protein
MKQKPAEGIEKLKILMEGEHVSWMRKSPQLRRDIDIYPELLTPEQQQRLNHIEQELLDMADKAEEETRTKIVLKGKRLKS